MRPRSRTAGPHRAGNTHSTVRPHTPTRTYPARPFVPAVAQTCHSHEHLQAITITRRHRGTVTVPAPVLLRPVSPAEGPIRATMKLYERGPPLSLAEWTGLAPIGEHPARGFAIAQPTAPGRDVGRIWHITPAGHLPRDQPPGAGRAGSTAAPPAAGPADHLRRDRRRAQGSCGLTGHPVQPVRYVRSHPLIKFTFLDQQGTDPAGPLQPQTAILRPIASATSAERPQHRDRPAAGHGHSGAELPRRHYSLRCWPGQPDRPGASCSGPPLVPAQDS